MTTVPKQRKKKKLGSYPYLSVIVSVTLALFVIGLFSLLVVHANKLTNIIKENIEVQVYLNKDITENQRIQIQKTLASKEYAARNDGEVQLSYISREQAAQDFIKQTGEDFSDFLGDNPLRDAYTLKIDVKYHGKEQMETVKSDIEEINGVFEVVYEPNLVESINENVRLISYWLVALAVLLLLAVVLMINNTIKLALFSQRFLVRSMQLVGARRVFIQRPFLWRSWVHGLLAGIIASGLLYLLLEIANEKVPQLSQLQEPAMVLPIFGALLLLGGLIAFLSTYRAIRKYLNMSLDELY